MPTGTDRTSPRPWRRSIVALSRAAARGCRQSCCGAGNVAIVLAGGRGPGYGTDSVKSGSGITR